MKRLLTVLLGVVYVYYFIVGKWKARHVFIDENGFDASVEQNGSWPYGAHSIRGHRTYNEDRLLAISNHTSFGLFAVFDGHVGPGASDFAADSFYPMLSERIAKGDRLDKALESAILKLDHEFMKKARALEWNAGSTACIAVVTPQAVTVANVGDSKAVVCRKQGSVQLTRDHHPQLPDERKRIEAAGGFVEFNRVNGLLAVSRAVGDRELKDYGVTARPEVVEYPRSGVAKEYLVVACDGIFEAMSLQDACDVVFGEAEQSELSSLASALVEQALKRGSRDNLSVIIVPV